MSTKKKKNSVDLMKKILSNTSDERTVAYLKRHREASLNGVDHVGHSPLTIAASQGKMMTIQWLLKHGANLEHVQHNGFNALSASVYAGYYEVARYVQYKGLVMSERGRELLGDRLTLYNEWSVINRGHSIEARMEVFRRWQASLSEKPKISFVPKIRLIFPNF
jgi:hypothetical protein